MPHKLRHRPIGDVIHPLAGLGVAVAGEAFSFFKRVIGRHPFAGEGLKWLCGWLARYENVWVRLCIWKCPLRLVWDFVQPRPVVNSPQIKRAI